jgi:GntR family transcriptional regulator
MLQNQAATGMLASVIDPDSALPPYEQVAVILRDEIAEGMLSGRVPSVHTISQRHHVSHRTAARALSILKGEGKIISVPGKGHYVRERQS